MIEAEVKTDELEASEVKEEIIEAEVKTDELEAIKPEVKSIKPKK